jgi:hypothetical protein
MDRCTRETRSKRPAVAITTAYVVSHASVITEKTKPSSTSAEPIPCPGAVNCGSTLAKKDGHLRVAEIVHDALNERGPDRQGRFRDHTGWPRAARQERGAQ